MKQRKCQKIEKQSKNRCRICLGVLMIAAGLQPLAAVSSQGPGVKSASPLPNQHTSPSSHFKIRAPQLPTLGSESCCLSAQLLFYRDLVVQNMYDFAYNFILYAIYLRTI